MSEVSTDIQGEIQISLKYDFNNSKLLVNVIKCRDLGLNNISGKTAEPFVSVSVVVLMVLKCIFLIQCSPLNSDSVNSEILLIQTGDYGPC